MGAVMPLRWRPRPWPSCHPRLFSIRWPTLLSSTSTAEEVKEEGKELEGMEVKDAGGVREGWKEGREREEWEECDEEVWLGRGGMSEGLLCSPKAVDDRCCTYSSMR